MKILNWEVLEDRLRDHLMAQYDADELDDDWYGIRSDVMKEFEISADDKYAFDELFDKIAMLIVMP